MSTSPLPLQKFEPDTVPLVTVLITSYQHGSFIRESILSILGQTYQNIELIVIDDGSRDGSALLIRELARQHHFCFLRQNNAGLAAVLNRGLALAKGKYFISMGGDDVAMLDRIEKQVRLMELRPQYAICGGCYVEIDAESFVIKTPKRASARELVFEDLFYRRQEGIKAPTAMVRTEILREVGGYDSAIQLEDIYMWLKITSAGHKAYITEDLLASYRKHRDNQSKDMRFMLNNIERIYARYKNHPHYEATINRIYINLYNKAVKNNYPYSRLILKKIKLRYYSVKHIKNIFYKLYKSTKRAIIG